MNPEMMRRLKKMQAELEKKQAELDKKEFTVEKQGIKVVIRGDLQIVKIDLMQELVDPDDKELLEDLMVVAFNEAIDLIQEEQEKITSQMPGGL
ncbi:YbaB/EbfC family nucleoid-associated protein [Mycoplasma corogypsi]|uniref:YbaB/EbfC family nucleoid-associated protein n=1 Tax=Mycoplasma corogypsi TaxID=2106 RepID=UPI003873475E